MFKDCRNCKQARPHEEFPANNRLKDGLDSWCRDCHKVANKKYAKSNRQLINERGKKRSKKITLETYAGTFCPYPRVKNCCICKLTKPGTEFHKARRNFLDQLQSYCKSCTSDLNNRPGAIARRKKWAEKNTEKLRQGTARYQKRKKEAEGHYKRKDIFLIYEKQLGRCKICREHLNGVFHIDHIIPLSKGGTNWPSNIQLLCPHCSQVKSNRLIEEQSQNSISPQQTEAS